VGEIISIFYPTHVFSKKMTINNKSYSSPKNINLREGILRFNGTQASNPLGDLSYGLYIDSSGNLIYRTLTTSVTLGAAGGGGSASSWDAIYDGDTTLTMVGAPLTFDRTTGNNDVLTITNTGAGSGDLIQITNVGTGNDIEGTSDTWHFSKAGDATLNMLVMAGDAGSDSLTVTAGDVVFSDGSVTITDADNAHTLSITNNSCLADSFAEFADSGAFTGTTTTSFFTITPSGLQSGTAVYIPLAAITTGMGLEVAGGTTQTSGSLVSISSAATGVTCTTGSMLEIASSAATGTSAVLVGISSAANDETTIMKILASDVLAAGKAVDISLVAMTTGSGIVMDDLDALTTGIGVDIGSSSTAITGAGRLLYVAHSGAETSSGTLVEFITAATDETVILKLTSAEMIDGINLSIVGTTGMTTGSLIRATTSTAGAVATNGIVSIKSTGAYTSTSNAGLLDVGSSQTVAGTLVHLTLSDTAQTSAQALNITQSTVTTGYTGNLVQITGSSTTGAGNTASIIGVNTIAGNNLNITNNALTLGAGTCINVNHTTSVLGAGTSLVRISSSSVDTGTTTGVLLDLASTGGTTSTQILGTFSALTTGTGLSIVADALTSGGIASFTSDSADTTTRSLVAITNDNTAAVGAVGLTIKNDSTAGAAMAITGTGILGIDFSALGVADSLFKATLTTDATMKAPQSVACDGMVKIMVGAVAHYIPVYTVA